MDSTRFPTTVQFFERLPKKLATDPLVGLLKVRCADKFGPGPVDVEKILWSLSELEDFFSRVSDRASPVQWVSENNAIQTAVSSQHGINQFVHLSSVASARIRSLKEAISALVFDFYSHEPDGSELDDTWNPLLTGLSKKGYWLDLVTTNYDLIIETSIRATKLAIGNGFREGPVRRLNIDTWRDVVNGTALSPYSDGLLTKLHGSVHWELERESDVVLGGTQFKGSHTRHALISPGFKGQPQREPFVSFHDYLESAIRNCHVALFIGFAFRDDHINDILLRNLGKKRAYCIDPSDLGYAPRRIKESLTHFPNFFDKTSVNSILAVL